MSSGVSRFRVRCRCGAAAEGPRLPRAQVVPCPSCRARLFVFPAGPRTPPPPRPRAWRGPLIAAVLCLLVLGAALVILLPWLARPVAPEGPALQGLRSQVEKARNHLALRRFHLAKADLAQLPLAAFPADEAR